MLIGRVAQVATASVALVDQPFPVHGLGGGLSIDWPHQSQAEEHRATESSDHGRAVATGLETNPNTQPSWPSLVRTRSHSPLPGSVRRSSTVSSTCSRS